MLLSASSTSVLNSIADLFYEDTTSSISSLKYQEAGDIWLLENIVKHKKELQIQGRDWSIVDNLVVHDEIKYGGENSALYIENYKETLVNLAKAGIKVVSYNFMPVFYKVRTHFSGSFSDPFAFSLFDLVAFTVFDLFILKRPDAEKTYNAYQKHKAALFNERLSDSEKKQLRENILRSVQCSNAPSLQFVLKQLTHFDSIDNSALRLNHLNFQKQIVPVAQTLGVTLHFNADNPASNLCNLPGV